MDSLYPKYTPPTPVEITLIGMTVLLAVVGAVWTLMDVARPAPCWAGVICPPQAAVARARISTVESVHVGDCSDWPLTCEVNVTTRMYPSGTPQHEMMDEIRADLRKVRVALGQFHGPEAWGCIVDPEPQQITSEGEVYMWARNHCFWVK